MKHLQVKRLTYVASAATLGAVAMMVLSIVSPRPIFLVLAMSLGQGLGTLSLAAYLLAIALDLNVGAALAEQVEESTAELRDDKSHE